MNKHILSVLALLVALAALAAAGAVWMVTTQYEADIAALQFLVEDLQGKVAALTDQTDVLGLGDTSLSAARRSDGNVDVTFTFRPADPSARGNVALKILADDAVAAQGSCQWNGEVYTTTVTMSPVNGCTYILVLEGTECVLASPSNGAYPHLINLADAANAYCNLVLGDWIIEGGRLTLDACHIQVQACQLDAAQAPATQDARIMLKHNGDLLESVVVTLAPGEGTASFEGTLSSLSMVLPNLSEGDEVDLWLEAVLYDGQVVSTCAGTWTAAGSGWDMAAG